MSEQTFDLQLTQMRKNLEQYRIDHNIESKADLDSGLELDRILYEVKVLEKAMPRMNEKFLKNVISHMTKTMWDFYHRDGQRPTMWRIANGDMNHLRVFLNMERI